MSRTVLGGSHRGHDGAALMGLENQRDADGLVHTVHIEETGKYYGRLDCGRAYTTNRKPYVERTTTKITRRPPTCVACIARLWR